MELTRSDPLPYGVEPNRAMLETIVGYAVEQSIIPAAPSVDSLFPTAVLGLTG
jgi:hypothetical protein